MKKAFNKILIFSTAMMLALGATVGLNSLDTTAEEGATVDIAQQTTTQRIYQGENNWYYLTGDFSENELYRMYYNSAYGWWQGYGHLGCSIGGEYNTAYPTNADIMLAYVVPEFGSVSISGRTVLNNIEDEKAIDAKIVHRSIDGTDTYIYNASVSDTAEDGVAFEQQTFDAKAGDVIFFVAETNSNLEAWDGITFDAIIEITATEGQCEELKNALNATTMPLTGAHAVTVTNNVVDAQGILTESMKLKQNASDRQKYAYRGTDGNYALFDYDATAVESGNPYRLSGMNYGDCSTGIEQYRVFYTNNGWTGASGMIYYIPANGYTSVFGKAVVNGTCDVVKVSASGVTTLLKTLSAGTYDFSQVTEVNNIPVNMGDFVGVFFDGAAWTTSSFVGAFDFYVTPTITAEIVVYPTNIELASDKLADGVITMTEGDVVEVTATVTPSNATDCSVVWASSDETVATVTNGVITAVGEGETIVTVTANGKADVTKTIQIKVEEKTVEPDNSTGNEDIPDDNSSSDESESIPDNSMGNEDVPDDNSSSNGSESIPDNSTEDSSVKDSSVGDSTNDGCSSAVNTMFLLPILTMLGFCYIRRKE